MDYTISISGFRRTFRVYQIGSNVNPYCRESLNAYLLRNYATYTPTMQRKVFMNDYKVTKDQ